MVLKRAMSDAIANNDAAAVRALAAAGVPLEPAKAEEEASGLGLACHWGARDAALALLELGAKPDPVPGKILAGTPLTAAAKTGDPVLIKALLDWGADPGRLSRNGYTALLAAARCGGPAVVNALRGKLRFPSDLTGVTGLRSGYGKRGDCGCPAAGRCRSPGDR